jgi:MFS family permease
VVGLSQFNRVCIKVAGDLLIISKTEGGISETQFGTIISAFLLTYTLAMIPGGWFIDRYGPRRALAVLLFASTVFIVLTGVVGFVITSPQALLVGLLLVRSLMGVFNAPLHPGAATMVFEHAPSSLRSLINGSVTFAAVVGISFTFYGFGWLVDRYGWPQAFLTTGALTLMVGLIWLWGTREIAATRPSDHVTRDEASTAANWCSLFRNRSVVFVTLSYVALGYFQYVFFYWINYYFLEVVGVDQATAGRNSTLITLAMGVAMAFGGFLIDRMPEALSPSARRRVVPFVGLAGSGAIIVWVQLSGNTSWLLPAFVASAALLGASESAFWTTANELGGRLGGTTGGFMNCGGNVGGVISPTLTPWLAGQFGNYYGESIGWSISLSFAGAISIVGALFWLGVKLPDESFDPQTPEVEAV